MSKDNKKRRLELQKILEMALGSKNVFFQPPPNIKLSYPCIIYNRIGNMSFKADDMMHHHMTQYELMYITTDPDEYLFDELIARLPYCSYNRHYVADRLHHNVYTIYF